MEVTIRRFPSLPAEPELILALMAGSVGMALGVLVQGEERGASASGMRVCTLLAELRVCLAASFERVVELRVAGGPPKV
eukprot:3087319-Pleurochrysis_carterae.AAC.1